MRVIHETNLACDAARLHPLSRPERLCLIGWFLVCRAVRQSKSEARVLELEAELRAARPPAEPSGSVSG
jgi:hypothetical protein